MSNKRESGRNYFFSKKAFSALVIFIFMIIVIFPVAGCRQYDNKFDAAYFFKTDPEKAVLDFIYALNNHNSEYIYNNLLLDTERRNISKEKFIEEMDGILSGVENIKVEKIVYLGYENESSKVVVEFKVTYANNDSSSYKKYFFLKEESGKWKIIMSKTFI
jgi:hypothetical protein